MSETISITTDGYERSMNVPRELCVSDALFPALAESISVVLHSFLCYFFPNLS